MNFAARLKELRIKSDMNQTQLAQMLNLKSSAISKYEKRITQPGISTLIKLSEIYGVSIDYLVGASDIENPYSIEQVSPTEANLIARYRKLSFENRIRIDERIKFLSEKQTQGKE